MKYMHVYVHVHVVYTIYDYILYVHTVYVKAI